MKLTSKQLQENYKKLIDIIKDTFDIIIIISICIAYLGSPQHGAVDWFPRSTLAASWPRPGVQACVESWCMEGGETSPRAQ